MDEHILSEDQEATLTFFTEAYLKLIIDSDNCYLTSTTQAH